MKARTRKIVRVFLFSALLLFGQAISISFMNRARLCPHCQHGIPLERGFYFDGKLNLVCAACGRVVYPTDAASEAEITTLVRSRQNYRVGGLLPGVQPTYHQPAYQQQDMED